MFYNKDNPQWKFSENQSISDEEYYQLTDEYNELFRDLLHADFRDMNEKLYGIKEQYSSPEEKERKRKKQLIAGIFIMIGFAGLVMLLIFKQLVIFGYCASALLTVFGISMIISGRGEIVESTSKAIINRCIGGGMAVGGLSVIILMLFRSRMAEAEFFILLFVIVFGIAGLTLLLITILKAISGKIIYTEEISAKCTGYIRYVETSEGSNNRRHIFIMTSPLFNYSYEGVQYEAVYDEFIAKKDSDVFLGETVSLRVDPKHPENIKSPVTTHPGAIIFQGFMAVACMAVAIGMGLYVAAGSAKGMTVETEWSPLINKINGDETSSKTKVTDEMIEELYVNKKFPGQEWYYEVVTVAENEPVADGVRIIYDDESFCTVINVDGTEDKPGTVLMVYYVIDEELLATGKHYKRSFAKGDPELFEYVGSHGAYEG